MRALLCLVPFLLLGCTSAPRGQAPPEQEAPAALSLFGEPLYAPELPADRRAELEANLEAARLELEARPGDEEALIWYGRRLAYLGRYAEAIETFTEGLRLHPESARLLRHRGHRWITLRRFKLAQLDLKRAAQLVRGLPDEIEPDGAPNSFGIPRSTLKSNITYHLGLAYYLDGDLPNALRSYRECLRYSQVNDDMLCATTHWYYMTLRRMGRDAEAAQLLGPIREDMEILENHGYHRLLRMYQGALEPQELYDPDAEDSIESATVAYGVGNWWFYNGPGKRAFEVFGNILAGDSWAAFGYIAAEADVSRYGPIFSPGG